MCQQSTLSQVCVAGLVAVLAAVPAAESLPPLLTECCLLHFRMVLFTMVGQMVKMVVVWLAPVVGIPLPPLKEVHYISLKSTVAGAHVSRYEPSLVVADRSPPARRSQSGRSSSGRYRSSRYH
uniref:Secreted protein n=1 Tax=Timema bartmani TaxID=61472 RepID=A0A7R9HX17_9NEOP|nr:unnamed protein product [Timema bartmani]